MARELFVATIVSAVWLTICFMCSGAAYAAFGEAIGLQRMIELENALGRIVLAGGITSIGRVSMLFYCFAMVVASVPINLYWLKRLHRKTKSESPA